MGLLENKVALVTGGAQGMGASHVRVLLAEGARVVITDILKDKDKDKDKGEALSAELGENTIFFEHDVTQREDWDTVIKKVEAAFGPIDVLVNNAGIDFMKPFVDFDY